MANSVFAQGQVRVGLGKDVLIQACNNNSNDNDNRDASQLGERRTGTPLTQMRFPGAARDFSPRVQFQCRLSYGVRTPPVCNRTHYHLCARQRSCSPCQSLVDCGNAKIPIMRRRLGSNSNFPCEKSQWDNTVNKNVHDEDACVNNSNNCIYTRTVQ